jgi:hypothetical protein
MGSLLVRPRFSWRWMNALKRGEFHEEKVARVHRRNPATAMRTRAGRKRSCGLDTIVLRRRRLRFGPVRVLLIGFVACFGVLLSFMGRVVLVEFSGSLAMQVAVSIAGIALMVAAATLMTWTSQLDRPGPRLF